MESAFLMAVVVAVIYFLSRLNSRLEQMNQRFDRLDEQLRQLRQSQEGRQAADKAVSAEKLVANAAKPAPAEAMPPRPVWSPVPTPATEPQAMAAYSAPIAGAGPAVRAAPPVGPPAPPAPELGVLARFLKNNPDLEKFIGENLINKIGIAILVLGIGYFVKYAIDQEWINEIGRVFIGLLAGGALIGLAHRMRRALPAFSSVLVGGGLAVLYFTVAIAFHQYQLFPQAATFAIMVLLTGFSILLSVSYNRVELAVLALLGGFATPFMVSTGAGNYQVLFIYILILNTGMLVLAYLKGWKILNWIAYVFTVVLYGGWLSTKVLGVANPPLAGALVFGTLYYLIFFGMNIINNIKEKAQFTPADISILLSNTFFYYAAGMVVLAQIQQGIYQGLFTVVLASFNFLFAYLLFRSQRADRNLIYLLLGLVITFISLAIPVQLEGNYITMFWALEAVLLLWLYSKSALKMIFLSASIMLGLMSISLVMDWNNLYLQDSATTLPVLVNKAFITSVISLVALALFTGLLGGLASPITFRHLQVEVPRYRDIAGGMLGLVLYCALALELQYQLNTYVALALNRTILTGTFNLAFLVGLLVFARQKKRPSLTWGTSALGMVGLLAYLVVFSPNVLRLLEVHFLEGEPGFIGFPFHYLSLLLVIVLLCLLYRNIGQYAFQQPLATPILVWVLCAAAVYIASSELLFHVIYFNFPLAAPLSGQDYAAQAAAHLASLTRQTNKVGFPILWGLCAFVLMFVGLRQKNRQLRIMALSLFTLTLLKLFCYDIRGISEGGKIAAFISLGILLLVISFMYQNLKRLILKDEAAPEKTP